MTTTIQPIVTQFTNQFIAEPSAHISPALNDIPSNILSIPIASPSNIATNPEYKSYAITNNGYQTEIFPLTTSRYTHYKQLSSSNVAPSLSSSSVHYTFIFIFISSFFSHPQVSNVLCYTNTDCMNHSSSDNITSIKSSLSSNPDVTDSNHESRNHATCSSTNPVINPSIPVISSSSNVHASLIHQADDSSFTNVSEHLNDDRSDIETVSRLPGYSPCPPPTPQQPPNDKSQCDSELESIPEGINVYYLQNIQ